MPYNLLMLLIILRVQNGMIRYVLKKSHNNNYFNCFRVPSTFGNLQFLKKTPSILTNDVVPQVHQCNVVY